MHIVCNSHSLIDPDLVSNLTDCSLKVSLIPNDDFSAVLKFSGKNFKELLDIACGEESPADELLHLHHVSNAQFWSESYLTCWAQTEAGSVAIQDSHFAIDEFLFHLSLLVKKDAIDDDQASILFSKMVNEYSGFYHSFLESMYHLFKDFGVFYQGKVNPDLSSLFLISDDKITVTDSAQFSGDEVDHLFRDVKEYVLSKSPIIIEKNKEKFLHRHNLYLTFINQVNEMPDFDIKDSNMLNQLFNCFVSSFPLFSYHSMSDL